MTDVVTMLKNLYYAIAKVLGRNLTSAEKTKIQNDLGIKSSTPTTKMTYRKVWFISDWNYGEQADTNFMKQIIASLKKLGITGQIYGWHTAYYTALQDTKIGPNDMLVELIGGADAGSIYEKGGAWYKGIKKNRKDVMVFMDCAKKITGLSWLERAHDDNYSAASFTGLANPGKYLTENGYDWIEGIKLTDIDKAVAFITKEAAITTSTTTTPTTTTSTIDCSKVNIKKGSTDTATIKKIQTQMQKVGYYTGFAVDGVFGTIMDREVRRFQAGHGLTFDGIVGYYTCNKLQKPGTQTLADIAKEESIYTDCQQNTNPGCSDWAYMLKVGCGDCWADAEFLYNKLNAAGIPARVKGYKNVSSSNAWYRHTWVEYKDGNTWKTFPYAGYGGHHFGDGYGSGQFVLIDSGKGSINVNTLIKLGY